MKNTFCAAVMALWSAVLPANAITLDINQQPTITTPNTSLPVGFTVENGYKLEGTFASSPEIGTHQDLGDRLVLSRVDGQRFFLNSALFWSDFVNTYFDGTRHIPLQFAKVESEFGSVVVSTLDGVAPGTMDNDGRIVNGAARFDQQINGTSGIDQVVFSVSDILVNLPNDPDNPNFGKIYNGFKMNYEYESDHFGLLQLDVSLADASLTPVPVPAAGGLLLMAIGGMWAASRRKAPTKGS